MAIRKRGKNSYLLIVELGYDAQGIRDQETKTIRVEDPYILRAPKRLQDHLDTEYKKFKIEVESGNYIKPEKSTFESFIGQWTRKFVNPDLEEKTKDNYLFQMKLRILPYFKDMHLEKIKTMHIMDYLEFLRKPEARMDGKNIPLGSATIVYNYRILRSVFAKAIEWNVLKHSPMTGVKKPKETIPEMKFYDEKEVELLFNALEGKPLHLRAFIMLAVTTGMRRGELAGLEWKSVDLDRGVVEIKKTIPKLKDNEPIVKLPKNNKTRKLSLADSVVEELKLFRAEWIKDRKNITNKWEGGKFEYLFCNVNGKPCDPQRLTKRWIEFHRESSLNPIRLHDLRHTSVSFMIFKKVHSEVIAKRTGHSNTKMIQIYGHIFDSVDQAAANVFDRTGVPKVKIIADK